MAAVESLPAPAATGLDHVTVPVREYRLGKRFYEEALRPLGFELRLDWPDGRRAFFGLPAAPSTLWLVEGEGGARIAVAAADRASVDAFYSAALAAGGRAGEQPAFRPEFTPQTYAASVVDPSGNTVEAVCRRAAESG
jgi:catechol 2,3-dioxygenase-like lactoylglutathione lyase family enzyme